MSASRLLKSSLMLSGLLANLPAVMSIRTIPIDAIANQNDFKTAPQEIPMVPKLSKINIKKQLIELCKTGDIFEIESTLNQFKNHKSFNQVIKKCFIVAATTKNHQLFNILVALNKVDLLKLAQECTRKAQKYMNQNNSDSKTTVLRKSYLQTGQYLIDALTIENNTSQAMLACKNKNIITVKQFLTIDKLSANFNKVTKQCLTQALRDQNLELLDLVIERGKIDPTDLILLANKLIAEINKALTKETSASITRAKVLLNDLKFLNLYLESTNFNQKMLGIISIVSLGICAYTARLAAKKYYTFFGNTQSRQLDNAPEPETLNLAKPK
jgi:hypothetical protein